MNKKLFGLIYFLKQFWLVFLVEIFCSKRFYSEIKPHAISSAIYLKILLWAILFLLFNSNYKNKYFFYYNLGLSKMQLWIFTWTCSVLISIITFIILYHYF